MTSTEAQGKKAADRPGKNIVHEQAILIETIKKELRDQKLCEHFSINPFVKSKHLNHEMVILIKMFK